MSEQFYNQLVDLYERRGVPPKIRRQIEFVLNEHNRLKETRFKPLPTPKRIVEVPLSWARPSIEPIPKPSVDIDIDIDKIGRLETDVRLSSITKRHVETYSEPIAAFESDPWFESDIKKTIRQQEDQHSKILSDIYRELSVDLPAAFKLNEYTRKKVDTISIQTPMPVIDKVKNEIDIDLSKLLDISPSSREMELLDVKPIDTVNGSQIVRIEPVPKLRKSWKGVSRVRHIDIGEIVKRVGYIQRSVNRSAKLAPLPKIQNKVRSLLGYTAHIPKYESIELVETQSVYMYINLRSVYIKTADDILAAQHRTSAEIDAWDVYVRQNWHDKDLFHDFVLDHYAPTFEAFNNLEKLVKEFIAEHWAIYNTRARAARQNALGMNLTQEQIKNLPKNPDHAWVSSDDLNLPTKKQ